MLEVAIEQHNLMVKMVGKSDIIESLAAEFNNIKNKNTDSYRVVTEGRLALEELLKLMDEENQS